MTREASFSTCESAVDLTGWSDKMGAFAHAPSADSPAMTVVPFRENRAPNPRPSWLNRLPHLT
jgi:hypothetical protein